MASGSATCYGPATSAYAMSDGCPKIACAGTHAPQPVDCRGGALLRPVVSARFPCRVFDPQPAVRPEDHRLTVTVDHLEDATVLESVRRRAPEVPLVALVSRDSEVHDA